ncbi:MAG TPA: hypothetical protein ENH85_11280 [Candidatus Scalindua sp.]|nr:hypothetical protein [Candidatus Scalindua sp.]
MTEVTNEDLLEKLVELSNTVHGKLNVLQHHVEIIDMRLKTSPPPIPPDPPEPTSRTVVMLKKAPLRELKRYNKKGKMVMRIHGGLRNRIKAQAGEELIVVGDLIKVDGSRNYAYRLLPKQPVNGKALPAKSNSTARHPVTKETDTDFFILAKHVRA